MNIQERYEEVKIFNKIAGNLDNVTVDSLEAQMKVVVEEVKELQDAFDSQNATELLDGACDAFVTLSGLMQKMEIAGFKVDKALQRVNENNMEKYPTEMLSADLNAYSEKGWDVIYNNEFDCYVLKDKNGKIRKPIDFQSVDIMDFLPEDFFGIMKGAA